MYEKMSVKTTSRCNWSRQIFILLLSLSVIGALSVWLVNYDNLWRFWNREQEPLDKIYVKSPDEIDSNSLLLASDYEVIDSDTTNQSSELPPQINHQEAFVWPVKENSKVEDWETVGTETQGIDNRWGNFRRHADESWDLRPEYTFDALGQRYHLVLKRNSDFAVPDLKVTYVSKNYSANQDPAVNTLGCFYSGFLKDDPLSDVSVSLCNGMRGHIISKTGNYYIQPAVETPNDISNTFLHKLVPIQAERTSSANGECAQHKDAPKLQSESSSFSDFHSSNNIRKKRSVDDYTIELMVVVDKTMVDFHGEDTQHYVLVMLHSLQNLYKDNGLGTRINIKVVNVTLLSHEDFSSMKGPNQTDFLSEFCAWQARERSRRGPYERSHDAAILLTRDNFCVPSSPVCERVIGFANVGTICNQGGNYSCALVKDNGHFAVATLAHELGHLLGMSHDDHEHCKSDRFKSSDLTSTIMARQMSGSPKPWLWSQCSKDFLQTFLEQGDIQCLYNNPNESEDLIPMLFGQKYSIDEQCEKMYGPGWQLCPHEVECRMISCHPRNNSARCRSDSRPWADGTPCGDKRYYWCRRGQCVPKTYNIPVVHGEWGEWQPFGACSRTCGGGIRESLRECNNPEPSETGEYCRGKSVRYESCNTQECPEGTPDFRAKQCKDHDTDTLSWTVFPRLPHNNCKLACKSSNQTATEFGYVIDGTPCNSSTFHVCVNGKCVEAGCDHVIGSKSVLDICGVCAGDNSTCSEVRKFYNVTNPHFGYNLIATIPAGSWDLDIRQYNYSNRVDHNYLAIKDPETDVYLLNGDNSVTRQAVTFSRNGITFMYNGIDGAPPETIKSSSRLKKNLLLEVLSVDEPTPFTVEFRYKIPNSQKFQWEVTDEWGVCNKPCSGIQKRTVHCIRKETGNVVAFESCAGLPKPAYEVRVCNDYCVVKWKEISRSECSSHCGKGFQKVAYRCSQEFNNVSISQPLPEGYCSHLQRPNPTDPCYGSCDQFRWQYYDWEPCSVSCGTGVQKRRAVCVDKSYRVVDDSMCARIQKLTETACYLDECPRWSTDEWSSCSVSCGRGYRRRKYWCELKKKVVPNHLCPTRDRPSDGEPCTMPACAPVWRTGEWSPCSVSCGIGVESRSVWCSDGENEGRCPRERRPSQTRECRLPYCPPNENEIPYDRYEWRIGDWGECSASCGKGMKRRSVECYSIDTKSIEHSTLCAEKARPHDIEPCEKRPCAVWRTSSWSPCSATCGQGTAHRYAWCELNGRTTLDVKCTDTKPDVVMPCNSYKPCVDTTETVVPPVIWRTGRWTECSVSCGGGTKRRNVVCLDDKGNVSNLCQDHDRPASSSPCNSNPCPDQIKWKYGDWSECNQTCGGGFQHRQAQCQSVTGENLPELYCSQKEIPRLVRQCENNPCVKAAYQWRTAPWNACSVSCDSGFQTRSVICERVNEYQPAERTVVHDMLCNQATKPDAQKECQQRPCRVDRFVYRWQPGSWSECSVKCGRGNKTRPIHCEKVNELRPDEKELVPDNFCNEAVKPKHLVRCRGTCNTDYMWVSGPWSECKGPCGEKLKYRTNQCYHKSGRPRSDVFCGKIRKPKTRKRCKNKKCEARSCLDIKRIYKTDVDQDYPINVLGRNISIYCHEMDTNHPKEFLSLPAGEMENYSEFYSKRLIDPDSCPVLKHKCCIEETTPYVGKTFFRKIRLNVTSMQVITNEFTFASTTGAWIPYGEAGDCYSRRNCPQGTFSINLAGTGLQIGSSVRWSEKGTNKPINVQIYHERRKIFGRCGGYCASCTTYEELKLDVLPP